jgi:hypothetical protein
VEDRSDKRASATDAARQLAAALDSEGCDYAIGGAIALGFWGQPRGTVDVDVTLFLPPEGVSECVRTLQSIGCAFSSDDAIVSLNEHGYCQVEFHGRRLDVFLPLIPFYEEARQRRQVVRLANQRVNVWDAETLCVFKLMFFRLKDLADAEDVLRVQGDRLDIGWVRRQIVEIYGERDPRVVRWDELSSEVSGGSGGTALA